MPASTKPRTAATTGRQRRPASRRPAFRASPTSPSIPSARRTSTPPRARRPTTRRAASTRPRTAARVGRRSEPRPSSTGRPT
jgi:hypothetical protein